MKSSRRQLPPRRFRLRLRHCAMVLAAAGTALLISIGCDKQSVEVEPITPPAREQRADDAEALLEAGKLDEAARSVRRSLMSDPESPQANLTAGRIEAARGNHRLAAEFAESVPISSQPGREAFEFRLEQLRKLQAVPEAIDDLVAALDQMPEQTSWRHLAWSLMNRVGRREEASRQAELLCRRGEATEQELLSLIRRNESFPPMLSPQQDPAELFAPGLGMARWHFTDQKYRQALEELSPQAEGKYESSAAYALYGRLLAETQAFEQIPTWHQHCDPAVKELGDYWAALGTYFYDQRQFEASARALLEAVYRNPTDRISMQRLSKVFAALGRRSDEEQFRHRAIQQATLERNMEALLKSRDNSNARQLLTRKVLELGRPFETLAWTLSMMPESAIVQRNEVVRQRTALLASDDALTMASESALIGVPREQFDLTPALEEMADRTANLVAGDIVETPDDTLAPVELVDVATQRGIEFQWYTDIENDVSSIPIHESVGGGIAVIDFDLDGWPDVYLAQGAGDPPTDQCTRSNQLLRSDNAQFGDVTEQAGALDFNYGAGLAAGDINQDGFPDLMLGSLGHNRLLINNGDGTFRDATAAFGKFADRFTSSLAIADISGDGLPDLFEAAYIEMEGAFELPKVGSNGREKQPSPLEHYAESDRWFESLDDGTFEMRNIDRAIAKPGTSLGVMVTDFDGDGKNEVFVGNDVRPNHYLLQSESGTLLNAADIKGVANGYSGSATGCMGIAHGDFDHDGRVDLHITNFSEESANLYMQINSGEFIDMAVRYGIDQISLPYVGFGTKAIDIDRNGWLDLIVTNGHIFDMRFAGESFRMPPQFLFGRNGHFEPTEVSDGVASDESESGDTGYWERQYLGRSMATLDFNCDAAIDVLIGHLDAPLALLENRTETPGNWIQLELVGVESERDAIGARVVVTAGGQTFSDWVTAGDGYFCSDQPLLDFGIGLEHAIQKIEIYWPSGRKQTFDDLQTNHRYLIVEGSGRSFHRELIPRR